MTAGKERDTGTSPFSFLSRRTVLKVGLTGGGLLLAGGGGLLALRGSAPAVEGLQVLSKYQYRVAAALARTIIPDGGPFPAGAGKFDMARAFDAYLADESSQVAGDLGMALTLVEFGPLLFEGRPAVFSHLGAKEQLEHWNSWSVSSRLTQRQAYVAFNKFFCLVFYDHPEVWKSIGWSGPSV